MYLQFPLIVNTAARTFLYLILSAIFVLSGMGVNVHRHYCGTHLVKSDVEIFSLSAPCCGDVSKPMPCCSDERVRLQLESDYQTPELLSFSALQFAHVCTPPLAELASEQWQNGHFDAGLSISPPPVIPNPRTASALRHAALQVFRI